MQFNRLSCCGVQEMANIQHDFHNYVDHRTKKPRPEAAEEVMKQYMSQWYCNPVQRIYKPSRIVDGFQTTQWVLLGPRVVRIPGAHVIFTDANDRPYNYGWRLARYIKKHDLGDLIVSKRVKNRNYNHVEGPAHHIALWVWTPKTDTLIAWMEEHLTDAFDPKGPPLQVPPKGYISYGLPYPFDPGQQ